MKNLIVLTFLVFSVIVVKAQDTNNTRKEKKAAHKALLLKQTKELLAAEAWQFDASQMLPSQGTSKTLTTSYNVVVKNGKVNSYLPFFGRAYSAPYGGTDSPMIFEATIENYKMEKGKKKTKVVKFSAQNKNDTVEFLFSFSVNGSAMLSVNSTNRQHISYYGDLVPIEKEE